MDPIHLSPAAPLAPRVLLPGDPGRALRLAQALLEKPRMFNHARGLWGYTGAATDGEPLTIQSTGMGGPSAAIVAEELIELGARVLVRTGTCGALVPGLGLGDPVVASEVVGSDGASAALGAGERLTPDAALTAALEDAGARPVTAVSTDLFYDPREDRPHIWTEQGAEVVEMEAAAVLSVAARREAAAAVLLAVSDQLAYGDRRRIGIGELRSAELRIGEIACAAIGASAPDPRP